MIKLKEPTKINGQIIIPYYIKDGEVMCFDKNGKQIFIDEKEFYKKPVQEKLIQTVIPIIKTEKKPIIKIEEIKEEPKEEIKELKEEPKETKEKKDNIIEDENYI